MPSTARKLNFLIEESVCRDLERLVPAGKRSRMVNEALRKESAYISWQETTYKGLICGEDFFKLQMREDGNGNSGATIAWRICGYGST